MQILSEFLHQSSLGKKIVPVNKSSEISVGRIGICHYENGTNKIIQTCIVDKIDGDTITIHPAASISDTTAEVINLPRELTYDGIYWLDESGKLRFYMSDTPVKRNIVDNGVIVEENGIVIKH